MMDKQRILEILEDAKDKNGKISMDIVRMAFDHLPDSQWISVSEQLPEEYDEYICTLRNGQVTECCFAPVSDTIIYMTSGWSTCEADGVKKLRDDEVIAWQKMPKPYEEIECWELIYTKY